MTTVGVNMTHGGNQEAHMETMRATRQTWEPHDNHEGHMANMRPITHESYQPWGPSTMRPLNHEGRTTTMRGTWQPWGPHGNREGHITTNRGMDTAQWDEIIGELTQTFKGHMQSWGVQQGSPRARREQAVQEVCGVYKVSTLSPKKFTYYNNCPYLIVQPKRYTTFIFILKKSIVYK